MKDLQKLEEQYKRLGDELERLKQNQWGEVTVPELKLKTIFAEKRMNWQEAKDWCEKQGGRLPTRFELQALAASDQMPEDKRDSYCWSSDSVSYWTDYAWYVYLYHGNSFTNDKTLNYTVLCVAGP